MKRRFFSMILSFILCTVFFAGCGALETESQPESTATYYNIETTEKDMGAPSGEEGNWQLLSSQFYQGEAVQIWCVGKDATESTVDVYLYREDESTELLVNGMPEEHLGRWFLDNNGESYTISGRKITRITADGTALYTRTADSDIEDICQLADGTFVLLVRNDEGETKLAELDAETGKVTEKVTTKWEESGLQYLSTNDEGLVLLDKDGLWSVKLADGSRESLFDFAKASYQMKIGLVDFCMVDEKNVKLLYNDKVETLAIGEVAQEKQVIVLRGTLVDHAMEEHIKRFNQRSEKYFIEIEQCVTGLTELGLPDLSSLADFRTQTDMQVVTGKGADILNADIMGNVESYIANGLVEDLKPYMDASGMKEEDFFPAVFDGRKVGDKIYGINFNVTLSGLCIDASLLGEEGEPTIETLVDGLLNAPEKTILKKGWESARVLEYFLAGSESLWGMVDWKKCSCDFDKELFAKMLEVAKKHGYDQKNSYTALARTLKDSTYYNFETVETLESEGMKKIGYFFEDGNHVSVNATGMWFVNSNSAVKEGAWEFFCFLLSEELQASNDSLTYPINKKAFDVKAQREIEEGSVVYSANGQRVKGGGAAILVEIGEEAYRAQYDLTPEMVGKIRSALEDVRALPSNTAPILNIILEEAESYFGGVKTIEEIIPIIENRVQLYLEENQ